MALSDTLAARIIETVKKHELSGNFLMLGRQRWVGSRRSKSAELFAETIKTHLPDLTEEDFKNADDEYSETFFQKLGFDTVDSMDVSPFEGASIIQDLSRPIDNFWEGKFDVIYDGGTCEHIFELPTAYRNLDRLLKPGGVLIGHSPCNNWINHSFYQINPEMVFGFWQNAMKYEVLDLYLQPLRPYLAYDRSETTNPKDTGVRPRILSDLPSNSPIVLDYAVRKPLTSTPSDKVYQSDYVQKWQSA